ncbi:bromodomain and WD repeat-containing protein 3-like isoform X1 [Macrosteles quadrilineatus]|uniref:bromodomain and WD repeat-containing protein 3-like isoform X1 n=1 Tax=Macrosteles quadrilineatus TaxID=74068 RepID=UPI0023E0C5D4|nr:bromodomain and WD repeat-containing protein 3-like isoform X1 [Macrosteles quadrilineatus]
MSNKMEESNSQPSSLDTELLFLITKYLESGPCSLTARILKQELVQKKLLPKRLDWEGEEHEQSLSEFERKYPHIRSTHLLEICSRIGPILDREIKPNVNGLSTLLGAGRQSLLRTAKDVEKLFMHVVEYSARFNHRALYPPVTCSTHNIVKVLNGRENSGPLPRSYAVSNQLYSKTQLLCCTLGHLSAVYCLLFDRTGNYVITGADDLLVKVWSAIDGRLLATLRGASAEISDIAINMENTLLAAGSIDRLIRVWCLQTAAPVAILTSHTGMITGVNFCPGVIDGRYYLASTSSDGSVAIWGYSTKNKVTTFNPKPIQFIERTRPGSAQMISAAFSSGGMFLAAGSADQYVRVYKLSGPTGPTRVLEVEAHSDRVDSIQWANHGLRFVSGSKDGTALIWRYSRQQWKNLRLSMATKLPRKTNVAEDVPQGEEEAKQKVKVTMVSWDCRDKWVVTACSDHTLKVWDSFTGTLLQLLSGHKDEVFVLEGHPHDNQIFMSAGHDGLILLWNVVSGKMIASFQNNIENQGHGAVFDAKWSPDGTMLAATDSHGQILMFGLGSKPARMLQLPKELFFHTDYRPLVRDASHAVLDEQTQMAPHLMPPPFLVDVDGNPYPPHLQRLVPGRENCTTEQLVPNIIFNQEGQQEVIQGVQDARSHIDQMILALAHQVNPQQPSQHRLATTSPRTQRTGARREGDVEGVRQSRGNWQRDEIRWTQKVMVKPLDLASLNTARAKIDFLGELELEDYERESLKPIEEVPQVPVPKPTEKKLMKKRPHAYRTRAVREQQLVLEYEDPNNLELSGSEEQDNHSDDSTACSDNLDSGSSSSSESASSEYSDWVRDEGEVLEPPKRRSKRIQKPVPKPVKKEEPQEVPEGYRPSEWLSAVIPKKFPYYPQMGDEVMFFKEGYQLYLDAVLHRKIYQPTPAQLHPWGKINIKEPELVKVVGIRYEVRPPHLCCLRLGVMKPNGQLTGEYFHIKYHDIPDVIDFFVLRQTYDTALDRRWEIGDRFRSMIDDHWWWGRIDGRRFVNESSDFLKYRIIWDNGESEFMSPWDMEPVEPTAEPVEVGGSIPVSSSEIAAILYRPRPDEWPLGDRDAACERILMGLDQVMELSVAEPFIAPVDLNRYPSYATVVEYPIDLSTIKARFEHRFYRRIAAAQFDIRYLATNTEKFNEAHSHIVKQARIVTDLCLKIVKETCTVDVSSLYRQLLESYRSSDSEEVGEPGPSTSRHRMKAAAARSMRAMRASRREASRQTGPFDWKRECREFLEMLWACRDSEPFREPLDRLEHPDYYRTVDTPMDLGTMREELRGDNYESPEDFCDDLRRIFANAKKTTDKRSRVYTMAVRLSALAETNMNRILNTWNNLNKRGGKKSQRRRKLLMSDDGNGSVSEYEPPSTKGPRKGTSSRFKSVLKRPSRLRENSDNEESNNDSDVDYHPKAGGTAVNGFSRKRKVVSRQPKLNGSNKRENDLRMRVTNNVIVNLSNAFNPSMPSTSKTVDSIVVKRAKMIHVEKNNDSSEDDEEEEILNHNSKRPNNSRKIQDSESENEEGTENTTANSAVGSDDENVEDEEEGGEVEDEDSESEESSDNESDGFKPDEEEVEEEKPTRKTVKVLYPKRRLSKETDSENSKENCVNSNYQNRSGSLRTRTSRTKVKGKYPLRQTTKKNLAEHSSDESDEDFHKKTRRTSQRVANGSATYFENSSESENSDEVVVDDSVNEDEAYSPPPSSKFNCRGRKRRRSSESTEWGSGKRVTNRLRNGGSKRSRDSDNGPRTRNLRKRESVRRNSDSELTPDSNNSDSDNTPAISVSSRGRVRKLTPRARALLRD